MALALLSNYATTTCVRMQPFFFIRSIMSFFLAQSSRVCLILPTHRWSFKCEWKCFNATFPNFFPTDEAVSASTLVLLEFLQEVHMDFIRLPCWWRKSWSPPNMRFSTNECSTTFSFVRLYNILEMHTNHESFAYELILIFAAVKMYIITNSNSCT